MSSDTSFDDLVGETDGNWRYSLSASDYERSVKRGSGLTVLNYRNKLKLVSEVIAIQEKVAPLGYMPTTNEMLNNRDVNEITPLLRQLGISGQGDDLSSLRTRKVAAQHEDIHLEGNVPIIINSELFAMIDEDNKNNKDETDKVEEEPYDPNRSLHEQFTTIKEFLKPSTSKEKVSNTSLNSIPTTSENVSSSSSLVCEEGGSSSNNTTMTIESGSEKNSNDEMVHPLLEEEQSYTPRQLYELKKLHIKQSLFKDHHSKDNQAIKSLSGI